MVTNRITGRLAVLWMVATLISPGFAVPQSRYDGPLIETHAHIVHYQSDLGQLRYRVDAIGTGTDGTTAAEYISNLDRNNIACTVGFHGIALDSEQENLRSHAQRLLDLYSGRLTLFAEIFQNNPLTWFDATSLDPVFATRLYSGFGEIQFENSPLDDDATPEKDVLPNDSRFLAIYSLLGDRGLLVMAHPSTREGLQEAVSYDLDLDGTPNVTWIIHGPAVHGKWDTADADGDGIRDELEKLEKLLDNNPNLYYTVDFFESLRDILNLKQAGSATAFLNYMNAHYDDLLQQMVDTWKGVIERHPDRFMWGTDMANHKWQWSSPEVLDMISTFSRDFIGQLTSPAAENYAYKNALRVFKWNRQLDQDDVAFHFKDASYSVSESGVTATITVEKLGGNPETVSVDFATSDGTAVAETDYVATSGTLTFAPGDPGIKTFEVTILNNDAVDGDRTVILTLSRPTNPRGADWLACPSRAMLTIKDDDVQFRFKDASYNASERGGTATINVEKLGGTPHTVSVNFATSDGTAIGDFQPDYVPTEGTLTFSPGDPGVKEFTVPILNDTIPESHETVNLTLSNPINPGGSASLATPSTAVLTILNDDVAFRFGSSFYTVSESAGTASISVERIGETTNSVAVDFYTSDGTAIGDFQPDYVPTSGTLAFSPGEFTKTFTVSIVNDSLVESNETVNLSLSNATNPNGTAALDTPNSAILTIFNDDVSFRFVSASYSVSEAGGTATITVEKLGGTPGTVSVNYATSDGTANAGADYDITAGTLTFGPGDPGIKTFTIPILNDTIPEPHETVNLALSNPINPDGSATLATPSTALLRILNDDVAFRFTSASYSVGEADGQATITVRRLGATPPGVSVDVGYTTTGGGTATAGFDYLTSAGILTFGPGETSKSFTVTINDDVGPEDHETVNLALSNPFNPIGPAALATPNTAVLTIFNDDVVFRFSRGAYVVLESQPSATITVRRTGATANDVSVDYATSGGTATAGSDYVSVPGTLTFAASDTSKSFVVTILNDGDRESNETAALALSNPSNASGTARLGGPSTAMLMIIDDDPAVLGGGL